MVLFVGHQVKCPSQFLFYELYHSFSTHRSTHRVEGRLSTQTSSFLGVLLKYNSSRGRVLCINLSYPPVSHLLTCSPSMHIKQILWYPRQANYIPKMLNNKRRKKIKERKKNKRQKTKKERSFHHRSPKGKRAARQIPPLNRR